MTKDELRALYEDDLAACGPTLSPQQIADYLQLSRTSVYALLRDGEIPSFKIGNKYYISKKVFIDQLMAGGMKTGERGSQWDQERRQH